MEGFELIAEGKFRGWTEGLHRWQWWRKDPLGDEFLRISGADERGYAPTQVDIGYILKVTCIPVDEESGLTGDMVEADCAELIKHGFPRVAGMQIKGGPAHSSMLNVVAEYFGGVEGESLVQWYRSILNGPFLPIAGASEREYWPTLEDVGSLIKVKFIPA